MIMILMGDKFNVEVEAELKVKDVKVSIKGQIIKTINFYSVFSF